MADIRTLKLALLADTKDFIQGLDKADKEARTFTNKLDDALKVGAAAFLAVGAAAATMAIKIGTDAVKAAIEDEKAQLSLAQTLRNTVKATDAQIKATENYIDATARATGVADDQLRPSLDRLVRSTGDLTKAQKLQQLALDISAGTGKDLATITEGLGKAYDGNLGALKRLGVSLDDSIIKSKDFDAAVKYWSTLYSDSDAKFDVEINLDANELEPFVTWGTNPGQGLPLNASVPNPADILDAEERGAAERALTYMGLTAGTPLKKIAIDTVFLGSCTNGRIEDLRSAAEILKGKKIASSLRMLVVPGSARVRLQAETEGLDKVFLDAGAEWRSAGCSMCLGMNPDQLAVGERSASTSNRNFEGRQGKGGRTHLVSPLVAAATALRGTLSSPADL